MGLGEPSPWVWLRDGTDRLFHAVSVWELPPEEDGPVAVCGRRVQVVSLFDEPAGGRCPACVAATAKRGGSGGGLGRCGGAGGLGCDEQRVGLDARVRCAEAAGGGGAAR